MTDQIDQTIAYLEGMNPLREPTLRAAAKALHLPPGSKGLDVGCGIGDQALLLAEETGPNGHVTGLDISPALIDVALKKARGSALGSRVSFECGDMRAIPFPERAFDWAWSVDCVGYPAGDLLPVLQGMCRVVRPGGVIALLGWTTQQLLPGHELLEARLNATCSSFAPFLESQPPLAHFQRTLHWFDRVGLTALACRVLPGIVQAPVSPEIRGALAMLFDMLWGGSISHASAEDAAAYRRLCRPESPDFIVDLPEYWGSFTYMMFGGRVPAGG